MFLLLIIPFNQHILLSILGSLILFSSFPPAKRIGPTSSWDDICEAASSPVARVPCLHFSRFSIVPFSLLSLGKPVEKALFKGPNVWGFLNCTVLYLYHRYLPAKMEFFRWLLLLHKSSMRLVADR